MTIIGCNRAFLSCRQKKTKYNNKKLLLSAKTNSYISVIFLRDEVNIINLKNTKITAQNQQNM